MKKIIYLITLLLLFPCISKAEDLNLTPNSKSSIMIEASTGEIIYEKNSKEKLAPASMTKIMSLILIMENIENGNLKWNEEITISENASGMGGSQIFLETGEKMTVRDLVKGICIASGNDATLALAERIAGTEEMFVKLMNKKAKKLGLQSTNFKNSTGLDEENHYSSAYDMSVMARELVKHDEILEFSSTYEDYLREGTDKSFWLVNTNKLVRFYQGVDGLKTGFTNEAGYCLTATAKRDNMRIITVVMGEPTSAIRSSETTAMLDYAFNLYTVNNILNKDKIVTKAKVELGEKEYVNIVPTQDINLLYEKSNDKRDVSYNIKLDKIKAPIKKGIVVGTLEIIENNKSLMEIDLTIENDIKKVGLFELFYRNVLDIIKGNI